MKFYNREAELRELGRLYTQAHESGRLTVITGRRRVGKTMLALEFTKSHKHLYFFVSKKAEHLLCSEYLEQIKALFHLPAIGEIKSFREIFTLLLDLSRKERFTLIIDEFQEFQGINPSIYSDMQHLWDTSKGNCRLNLICIGSIQSLMYKIFEQTKEPLFGRADRILRLRPFSIHDIHAVLSDHRAADSRGLFDLYLITGGLPKYLDLLTSNTDLTLNDILDFVLSENSPFIDEGRNLLIEEFGREHGTYFSILELIAAGKTGRPEIDSYLGIHSGAYLTRLESEYAVISRHKPINEKPKSRLQKYAITDNFLNFWFRFIFSNRSAVETGNFGYLREIITRDYSTYAGRILERFYRQLFAEKSEYNKIGAYWERGNKNEIDLVAVNNLKKVITIADIKLSAARIDLVALRAKSAALLRDYAGYKPSFLGLSLNDILQHV
ncbi:MAG TPA: ATP-binding protein [Dissulfurispiraceae bacterium]|nr:ATP-binding protein [Dissulfurispiraceae bacterium]